MIILFGTLLLIIINSCKKLVEVNVPNDRLTSENIYATDQTALAVLTNIYGNIGSGRLLSLTYAPALLSDEFSLLSNTGNTTYQSYYTNNLFSATATWLGELYSKNYIYTCNAAIEGMSRSESLSTVVKKQLLGEAYFSRAFFYFYLINYYGDVPLVLSTDYKINQSLSRSSQVDVYNQIVEDLNKAIDLLSENYINGSGSHYSVGSEERLRPNKWAAYALLARCYLYINDWENAEAMATKVISNTVMFNILPLNDVFLKNSQEAIWQAQPVLVANMNTEEARLFTILPSGPTEEHPFYLSTQLLNSFETNDQRATNWVAKYTYTISHPAINYYYPYKYKVAEQGVPVTEYSMILRLGEQYLIRAEARVQTGNVNGAVEDLNKIRNRAGLPNYIGTIDKPALLKAILHERQVELFTEWGHRWLDLKRTNEIDSLMSTVLPLKANGKAWQSFMQWCPIPADDILKDPNLTQNDGY